MIDQNRPLTFNNVKEVKAYAQKEEKILLLLKDRVLDVTTFSSHHPGGGMLLKNKNFEDIQEQMQFHHPLTLIMANSMAIGSFKDEIKRMIDPSKPISPQIWSMDKETYMKIINSPHWLFVESPRLFQSNFVQSFTHNKWYHIPLVPALIVGYFFYNVSSWHTFNPLTFIMTALAGLLAFSLMQYCLHRFIFHSEDVIPDSRFFRYIHFFTHGLHHVLPNDPDRLVLPIPLFLALYFLVIICILQKVIKIEDPILYATFWSFVVVGYVIYDVCHYALHHIDTTKSKDTWFHRLQVYHNRHHFSGEDAGFGVSSPLWDYILRTTYKQKKNS